MRTLAKNPKLKGVKIPDGLYEGSWSGYVVIFKVGEEVYEADAQGGIRGKTKVTVTANDGSLVVETLPKS